MASLDLDGAAPPLRLRTLTAADAGLVAAATATSDDAAWSAERPPYSVADAARILGGYDERRARGEACSYGVFDEDGRLVAALTLQRNDPGCAEIGGWTHPDHRSRGIGTEALRLLPRLAHERLGIVRLWLEIDPGNAASLRAAEKAGYAYEGIARAHCPGRGSAAGRHDCAIYAHLPGDRLTGHPDS